MYFWPKKIARFGTVKKKTRPFRSFLIFWQSRDQPSLKKIRVGIGNQIRKMFYTSQSFPISNPDPGKLGSGTIQQTISGSIFENRVPLLSIPILIPVSKKIGIRNNFGNDFNREYFKEVLIETETKVETIENTQGCKFAKNQNLGVSGCGSGL